MAGEREERRRG